LTGQKKRVNITILKQKCKIVDQEEYF